MSTFKGEFADSNATACKDVGLFEIRDKTTSLAEKLVNLFSCVLFAQVILI